MVPARLQEIWEDLHSSLWFVPVIMTAAAAALALFTLGIDNGFEEGSIPVLLYGGSGDGAREILSVIASSIITVTGVVFSITMVVLSLTASQYGPRLLVNFMRDTGNQVVLGTFIGTFVFCLLVLRTVRTGDEPFVPELSVTLAIILALASLGVLIYFIHHMASSIQPANIAANVGNDLMRTIDHLFPQRLGVSPDASEARRGHPDVPDRFVEESATVPSDTSGYLQAVDNERLMELATDRDIIVQLLQSPGSFVTADRDLVRVWPAERVDEDLGKRLNRALVVGHRRTPLQDTQFTVQQLAEIAVRALSPGINDPVTAITCIDWLGAALAKLADRELPANYRYDQQDRLRIITEPVTFGSIIDAGFDMMRQHVATNLSVAIRLLEVLERIGRQAQSDEVRSCLRSQADALLSSCATSQFNQGERGMLEARYRAVLQTLASPGTHEPVPTPQ